MQGRTDELALLFQLLKASFLCDCSSLSTGSFEFIKRINLTNHQRFNRR